MWLRSLINWAILAAAHAIGEKAVGRRSEVWAVVRRIDRLEQARNTHVIIHDMPRESWGLDGKRTTGEPNH